LPSERLYDVMIFCQVKVKNKGQVQAVVEKILREIDKHPEVVTAKLYNFKRST